MAMSTRTEFAFITIMPCRPREKSAGQALLYEIKNDGYDPDKITGGGRPETPEKNELPEMLRQWKAYKDSGFKTPPGSHSVYPRKKETRECGDGPGAISR